MRVRRWGLIASFALIACASTAPAAAAPADGTLVIGVHVTLVNRWLDPGDTEGLITPFMVLYAIHDALVKPMPGNISTPSLAESWTLAKDNVTYDFVLRKISDESTRGAAVKTGEVDIAYLFGGTLAEDLRRSPGVKIVAPLVYGVYWMDFLDQWDPKSPWNDRRVRLAASLALDRQAINQAEMLGFAKVTGSFVPSSFEFALPIEPHPYDPKRAKQLLAEAGYPNGFEAGDLTPLPPYTSLAEGIRRLPPGR